MTIILPLIQFNFLRNEIFNVIFPMFSGFAMKTLVTNVDVPCTTLGKT